MGMKINNTNNNINNIIHIPYQQHAPQQHQHEPLQSTNTNTTSTTNTHNTHNTYEQQCRRGSLRALQESIIVYQRAHLKQHPYGIDSYGLIDLYA